MLFLQATLLLTDWYNHFREYNLDHKNNLSLKIVNIYYFKADYLNFYALWKQLPLRQVLYGVFHFAFLLLLNTFFDMEDVEKVVSTQEV